MCTGGPLHYDTPIYIEAVGIYPIFGTLLNYYETLIVLDVTISTVSIATVAPPQNRISKLFCIETPTVGSNTITNGTFEPITVEFDAEAADIQTLLNDAVADYPFAATGDRYHCTGGPLNMSPIFVESVGDYAGGGQFGSIGNLKFEIRYGVTHFAWGQVPDEGILPGDLQIQCVQRGRTGFNYQVYDGSPENFINKNVPLLDHLNIKIFSDYMNWLEELNTVHGWGYTVAFKRVNALGELVLTDYEPYNSTTFIASGHPISFFEYFRQARNLITQISADYHKCTIHDNWFWAGGEPAQVIGNEIGLGKFKTPNWQFSPTDVLDLGKYGKYAFADFLSLLPVQFVKSIAANNFLYPRVVDQIDPAGHFDYYPMYTFTRTTTHTLLKDLYTLLIRKTTLDLTTAVFTDYEYFRLSITVPGNQYRPMSELTATGLVALFSTTPVLGTRGCTAAGQVFTFSFITDSNYWTIELYPPGYIINQQQVIFTNYYAKTSIPETTDTAPPVVGPKQNVQDMSRDEIISDGIKTEVCGTITSTATDNFSIISSNKSGFSYLPDDAVKGICTKRSCVLIIDTGGKSLRQFMGLRFKATTLINLVYNNTQYLGTYPNINSNTTITGFGGGSLVCNDVEGTFEVSFGVIDGYLRLGANHNTDNEKALAAEILDGIYATLWSVDINSSNINDTFDLDVDVAELNDLDYSSNLFFIKVEAKLDNAANDSITKAKDLLGVTSWSGPSIILANGITGGYGGSSTNLDDTVSKFAFGNLVLNTENNIYFVYGGPT